MRIKRAYEKAEEENGIRVLADRLWPRKATKQTLAIDERLIDLAPSAFFSHPVFVPYLHS
ncbi:DUF488 family protein, N3 subclade [Bacillus xiapuensis]|uniref:DUF488 family protein, N3 subclade n=1 Tax=Bacillus xiapuensis TaxID=2014075 RepID=UPI000C25119D|nr:DUF488 family protein [Bacillus xiapuensis]